MFSYKAFVPTAILYPPVLFLNASFPMAIPLPPAIRALLPIAMLPTEPAPALRSALLPIAMFSNPPWLLYKARLPIPIFPTPP